MEDVVKATVDSATLLLVNLSVALSPLMQTAEGFLELILIGTTLK